MLKKPNNKAMKLLLESKSQRGDIILKSLAAQARNSKLKVEFVDESKEKPADEKKTAPKKTTGKKKTAPKK